MMELPNLIHYYGMLFLYGFQMADAGLLPNGILISSAKKSNLNAALAMKTTHLFIVPTTPLEFVRNPALISKTLSLSNDKAPLSKFISVDFDYQSEIVYLYDQQTGNIIGINRFRSIVDFHRGVSRSVLISLAVDWVSHNVYWTDPMFGWIAMQPGNVVSVKHDQYKVVIDNLNGPRGIAVAPNKGYMFFSDFGKSATIQRASLTGEDRTVIVSQNILHPVDIAVDISASQIVWVDETRDTIECADFDGLNRRVVRRQPHSAFFDVGVYRDILGVINLQDGKLNFFDKNTGGPLGKSIESKTQAFRGVGFYSAESQPQQLNLCLMKRCSDMCISSVTEAHCVCKEGFKLNNDNLTCTEKTGSLHRGVVLAFESQYCLLDIRSVVTSQHLAKHKCVLTKKDIFHMDIDSWNRQIVFASDDGIYSNVLGAMSLPRRLVAFTETITGLALDWTDKNVYWSTGRENGSILALSQQSLTQVAIHDKTLSYPRGVVVLPLNRKLMWISGSPGNSQISMSNMDGTDIVNILGPESLISPQTLAVDANELVLFWSDNGYIRKSNIDGTDVTTVLLSQTELPSFLDVYKGYFLFSSNMPNATINTFTINNPYTHLHMYTTGNAESLRGLKILDEARQPYVHNPCNVLNGGCEHICLFNNNEKFCQCNFGFTLDFNGQTCSSEPLEDDFIIVADWTHNELYMVSMVTDDIRAVDVDGIDQPAAVAYNYKTQEVIWGETTAKKIKSAFVDGLNYTSLLDTGLYGSHPDRFAIDFTSGNVYYTAVNTTAWGFKGVGVITPTGKHKKLIADGAAPRDIVVDPDTGLLFWTDHGADFPFVKRANMDGTDIMTIVAANIIWPNGLAIDHAEKHLYVTDGQYNTIQRCNYIGYCDLIYSDPLAHLMDIDLMGDYIFFTAWNRPYIAKMHKTNTSDFTKLIERAELGRLDSISVYSSGHMNNPESEACSDNNGLGECSTFCFPMPTGFTCGCEDGVNLLADKLTCENVHVTNSSDEETIFVNKDLDVVQLGGVGAGRLDIVLSGSDLDVVQAQSDLQREDDLKLQGAIHKRRRRRSAHASDAHISIYSLGGASLAGESFKQRRGGLAWTRTESAERMLKARSRRDAVVSTEQEGPLQAVDGEQTASPDVPMVTAIHTEVTIVTTVAPSSRLQTKSTKQTQHQISPNVSISNTTANNLETTTVAAVTVQVSKETSFNDSLVTKTTLQPSHNVNRSLPVKGAGNTTWLLPLIFGVVGVLISIAVVIGVITLRKRKSVRLRHSETANVSVHGLTNPMFENLITREDDITNRLDDGRESRVYTR